jgi:hypothetical protein
MKPEVMLIKYLFTRSLCWNEAIYMVKWNLGAPSEWIENLFEVFIDHSTDCLM